MARNDDKIEIEIIADRTKNKDTRDSPRPNYAGKDVKEPRSHGKMKAVTAAEDKLADKVRAERKEVSRLVSLANKRLKRLEEKGYTDNPAYVKSGGYFSIKGKNHNETQKELARLNRFINATTSTIRGTNRLLKEMAENTGVKYNNLQDLRKKAAKFFELDSKVKQYLRTVEDMASAIDYKQIWEQVNIYVDTNRIDLAAAKGDIDAMIIHVVNQIKAYEDTNTVQGVSFRLKK